MEVIHLKKRKRSNRSMKDFAVIARNWEYFPFWLKAKIYLMCVFYAWRNRLRQQLGLKA